MSQSPAGSGLGPTIYWALLVGLSLLASIASMLARPDLTIVLAALVGVVVAFERTFGTAVPPAPEPTEAGPIHTYYGGHEITKAVEDVWSPIETVVAAVEKQIASEVRISASYSKQPELIYEGHPWMTFVRSGGAEYLGWSRDHKPGPSPIQRKRDEAADWTPHLIWTDKETHV